MIILYNGEHKRGNMDNEYFTVKEFASLLRLDRRTITNAIREGRIAAIRMGDGIKAHFRIPRHQIDRLTLLTEEEKKKEKEKK